MNLIKPKKKFGQNFLTDKNIAEKIVSYLAHKKAKTILEIGPGKGILSKLIMNKDLRRSMGIKGRKMVEKDFSAEIVSLQTGEVWNKLINYTNP